MYFCNENETLDNVQYLWHFNQLLASVIISSRNKHFFPPQSFYSVQVRNLFESSCVIVWACLMFLVNEKACPSIC
jgi:hypothetical protein